MKAWSDGTVTLTTTDEPGGFRATCPKGHQNNHVMTAAQAREIADGEDMELWCRECDHTFLVPPFAVDNLRRWATERRE